MNSEFPDQISDHDPQVVRLAFPARGGQGVTAVAAAMTQADGHCDALLWKM